MHGSVTGFTHGIVTAFEHWRKDILRNSLACKQPHDDCISHLWMMRQELAGSFRIGNYERLEEES
jgi:hypothetical protein